MSRIWVFHGKVTGKPACCQQGAAWNTAITSQRAVEWFTSLTTDHLHFETLSRAALLVSKNIKVLSLCHRTEPPHTCDVMCSSCNAARQPFSNMDLPVLQQWSPGGAAWQILENQQNQYLTCFAQTVLSSSFATRSCLDVDMHTRSPAAKLKVALDPRSGAVAATDVTSPGIGHCSTMPPATYMVHLHQHSNFLTVTAGLVSRSLINRKVPTVEEPQHNTYTQCFIP